MSFDPKEFLTVSSDLKKKSDCTEAEYRTIANRAYYAAFGYIKQNFPFINSGISAHQETIDHLERYYGKKVSKMLENLFKMRKDADYKYNEEFKSFRCDFVIQDANKMIKEFENLSKRKI